MDLTLKAESRNDSVTKSDLKKMREQGKVPAVVYGKKVASTPISVDEKQLMALLKHNPHAIVEMDIPNKGKHPVMINGIQRDSIQRSLLHIDFHQINMNEPIRTTIGLEFTGESPAQREGGVLTAVLHEVEVRCLPQDLPTSIAVDISGLELGGSFLAKDLQLPPEIELKTDDNAVLATILVPQKAAEETETAVEEAKETESAGEAVKQD
ncbi:50S ribosomal protein L25 [Paenibacillus hemerocallicola]|uniref:Large ribosomal subunit protein bL25 n=1 Tax=Paenibacillus hemerocallicola TaxID=1172614 RepID=A0A5C4T0N0_9BACL|nr:50S ribosomal protein L25 [Paenibacillus hemerocallicola]TNJ62554.1 50S ribosomal protein L25 [Paenibacillus hemerocallicola]